jgi:hypothetical protein
VRVVRVGLPDDKFGVGVHFYCYEASRIDHPRVSDSKIAPRHVPASRAVNCRPAFCPRFLHRHTQVSTGKIADSSCQEKTLGLVSCPDCAGKPKKLNGTIERGRSGRKAAAPSMFLFSCLLGCRVSNQESPSCRKIPP